MQQTVGILEFLIICLRCPDHDITEVIYPENKHRRV